MMYGQSLRDLTKINRIIKKLLNRMWPIWQFNGIDCNFYSINPDSTQKSAYLTKNIYFENIEELIMKQRIVGSIPKISIIN